MLDPACLNIVADFLPSINLIPPPDWISRVQSLYSAVVDANRTMNLTRITTPESFLIKHVVDSLLLVRAAPDLLRKPWSVADVGCGAGFPGIPLAIFLPQIRCTEIDSTQKKIRFVHRLIESLEIKNCQAICGRGRELAARSEYAGQFDVVVVRAVKDAAYVIQECGRLLRPANGLLAIYKTPAAVGREEADAREAARNLNLSLRNSPVYELPAQAGQRQFFMVTRPGTPSFKR